MTAPQEYDRDDDADREARRCDTCLHYRAEVTRYRPRCRLCEEEERAERAAMRRDFERHALTPKRGLF